MEVEPVAFLAGQLVTVEAQEVMVSTSVEKEVWVETAKAEAANKETMENCILIV